MNEKLNPCPFCGGEAILATKNMYGISFIFCNHCGIEQPSYKTEEEAINAWNTRVKE